jgi:hypothetical protein
MALPKIDVPVYDINLPLTKKNVRYRPFLVKEEKILLMAMESGEEKTITDAIKQIVNNCCLEQIDVDELPILDLEFLFLNLRSKSVGEIVELQYKCNNIIKDENGKEKNCGNLVKFNINLLEIKPEFDTNHDNKILLGEKLGVLMKYPNFKSISNISEDDGGVQSILKIISNSIDCVFDDDNMYYRKDISDSEMMEFLENLNREQFAKIQNFFETIPKIQKNVQFKCVKCGYNEQILIEGIQNFFV